jgi:hypothetical protein
VGALLTSGGSAGIAAEIPNCRNVHIVDVPSAARTLDRIEGRLARQIPFFQLDLDLAVSLRPAHLAEGAIAVVVEVAGKNYLALLELGAVHRLSRGSVLGAENGGHGLEIFRVHRLQELIDRELRRGRARDLSVASHLLGSARTGREKEETGDFSKGHDRILQWIELRPRDCDNAC